MSITVTCPSCSAQFHAPDDATGKTTHCPKCRAPITIPVPPRPLATEKQKDYARELGIQSPENDQISARFAKLEARNRLLTIAVSSSVALSIISVICAVASVASVDRTPVARTPAAEQPKVLTLEKLLLGRGRSMIELGFDEKTSLPKIVLGKMDGKDAAGTIITSQSIVVRDSQGTAELHLDDGCPSLFMADKAGKGASIEMGTMGGSVSMLCQGENGGNITAIIGAGAMLNVNSQKIGHVGIVAGFDKSGITATGISKAGEERSKSLVVEGPGK